VVWNSVEGLSLQEQVGSFLAIMFFHDDLLLYSREPNTKLANERKERITSGSMLQEQQLRKERICKNEWTRAAETTQGVMKRRESLVGEVQAIMRIYFTPPQVCLPFLLQERGYLRSRRSDIGVTGHR
jgi:hypothetical protein